MSPAVLGKAQAVVTVAVLLATLLLFAGRVTGRVRAEPEDGVTRYPVLTRLVLVFYASVGGALLVIGLLQLWVEPAPYAVLNLLIGASALFVLIRVVVRARR
jgi:hypothetical protein